MYIYPQKFINISIAQNQQEKPKMNQPHSSSTCSAHNHTPEQCKTRRREITPYQSRDSVRIFQNIFNLLSTNLQDSPRIEERTKIQKLILGSMEDNKGTTTNFERCTNVIQELAGLEPSIYICALIILDRILRSEVRIGFKSTLRRLAFLSLFIAFKMFTGQQKISKEDFSKMCRIPQDDFAQGEVFICCDVLNWNLNIEEDYFVDYSEKVKKYY